MNQFEAIKPSEIIIGNLYKIIDYMGIFKAHSVDERKIYLQEVSKLTKDQEHFEPFSIFQNGKVLLKDITQSYKLIEHPTGQHALQTLVKGKWVHETSNQFRTLTEYKALPYRDDAGLKWCRGNFDLKDLHRLREAFTDLIGLRFKHYRREGLYIVQSVGVFRQFEGGDLLQTSNNTFLVNLVHAGAKPHALLSVEYDIFQKQFERIES